MDSPAKLFAASHGVKPDSGRIVHAMAYAPWKSFPYPLPFISALTQVGCQTY